MTCAAPCPATAQTTKCRVRRAYKRTVTRHKCCARGGRVRVTSEREASRGGVSQPCPDLALSLPPPAAARQPSLRRPPPLPTAAWYLCVVLLIIPATGYEPCSQLQLDNDMEHVKKHQAKAASDLYRILAATSDGNLFISPFSISTALSMAFGGADGNTAVQMRQALALPEEASALHDGYMKVLTMLQNPPNVTLNTANKMYVQNSYNILESYTDLLKRQYLSEVKSVDFGDAAGTSKLINGDVESLTRGKIKDLIDPNALNPLVRLVLVNAIYFKGSWNEKFEKEATAKRDFFVTPDNTVKVDMMYMDGKKFNCGSLKELGCKALQLPYEGRRFSMLLLLPDAKDGLKSLEEKLSKTPVQSILEQLRSEETTISIPKFKLETSYDLIDHLKKLGIADLFNADLADLSKISGAKDLFVSKVIHKAFIDVNEEGAEAAAATGMVMMMRCMPMDQFEFFADHPFFFAIVDSDTGLALFSGRYVKPE